MRTNGYKTAIWYALVLALLLPVDATGQRQIKVQPNDLSERSWFGWSIAMDGNLAVTGALIADYGNLSNTGAAFVYERDEQGNWIERQRLDMPAPAQYDEFGHDVAIDGGRIAVSSRIRNVAGEKSGAVYVFEQEASGDWVYTAEIRASDAEPEDLFGDAIALDGDRLVVGAIGEDDGADRAGAAYVFEYQSDGTWLEVTRLKIDSPARLDRFGDAVALDGDRLAVGSSLRHSLTGAVAIFERDNQGAWNQVAELVASDAGESYVFGWSLALQGSRLIVGSPDSEDPLRAGSAYVFEVDQSGVWTEVARLEASDTKAQLGFAHDIALDGDWAIIGTNVDEDTDLPEGAVYVFHRGSDGMWQEVHRIQASDHSGYVDKFGTAVAIEGERVLVGAPRTDGDGIGVFYELGNIMATPVDRNSVVPARVFLHSSYPNPFNPSTTLRFELPIADFTTLDVYDILGRHITRLASGVYTAGAHEVTFDAGGLPTGPYFCVLRSGATVRTSVTTLVR